MDHWVRALTRRVAAVDTSCSISSSLRSAAVGGIGSACELSISSSHVTLLSVRSGRRSSAGVGGGLATDLGRTSDTSGPLASHEEGGEQEVAACGRGSTFPFLPSTTYVFRIIPDPSRGLSPSPDTFKLQFFCSLFSQLEKFGNKRLYMLLQSWVT